MPSVKITCDSTADLTAELYKKYDVEPIPLYITLNDTTGRDGVEVKQKDVFSFVERTGTLPKTAAVTMLDYAERFSGYVRSGLSVVHLNISSHLSASYQNAVLAAKEVGNVYVVDSYNLSTGTGLLVLMAAELARAGLSACAIAETVCMAAKRLDVSFVVDTLDYLHKGGRCSALAQLGANVLRLKPCIEVKGGKMGVGRKYRGKLSRCLGEYINDKLGSNANLDFSRIFITHTVQDPSIVSEVKAQVEAIGRFSEVLVTEAGCTISSHCGPGTLGVLFFRKA